MITADKLLWAILIFLAVGYMVGTFLNRRTSKRAGLWLNDGLSVLGSRPVWQWLGSLAAGARVTHNEAARPFSAVEITYFLQMRELPLLWLAQHLRGKRDLLVIRAELRQEIEGEIEALPARSPLRKLVEQQAGDEPWAWQTGPSNIAIATRGAQGARLAAAALPLLERYGAGLERWSIRRRRKPAVLAFVQLHTAQAAPSAELFKSIRAAAGQFPK